MGRKRGRSIGKMIKEISIDLNNWKYHIIIPNISSTEIGEPIHDVIDYHIKCDFIKDSQNPIDQVFDSVRNVMKNWRKIPNDTEEDN